MSDILMNAARKAAKRPGKTLLQALVIAAGALAFSAGLSMAGSLQRLERETYRYRISVASGETDEAGRFEYTRPSVFTDEILGRLASETGFITATAAVNETRWPAVRVGGSRYSIRSVLSAEAGYPDIMGLDLVAGRFFTAEESASGARLVVLSRSAAVSLFGTEADAVGKTIESERGVMMFRRGQDQAGQARLATETYTVTGVYEDPSELARAALGIPDALIPFGADRPPGLSARSQISVFVAETDGSSAAALKSRLTAALASMGVEDAKVETWEGDPGTPNATAASEARKALSSLAGAIVGLGILVLAASVFGIYSSTAMEAVDGRKGTAVRRALGESSLGTVLRFMSSNALFGAAAAVIGALVSLPAYRALAVAAESVLSGAGMARGGIFPSLPPLWAPVAAVAATALACALFSLPPAVGASRAGIVEGIQEL